MTGIQLFLLLLASLLAVFFVVICERGRDHEIEELAVQDRYITELCEILHYAHIAVHECIDDPEEREIILDYIGDFDDLIIEDCLRIEKCGR